jgi:hypothetical protein
MFYMGQAAIRPQSTNCGNGAGRHDFDGWMSEVQKVARRQIRSSKKRLSRIQKQWSDIYKKACNGLFQESNCHCQYALPGQSGGNLVFTRPCDVLQCAFQRWLLPMNLCFRATVVALQLEVGIGSNTWWICYLRPKDFAVTSRH